MSSPTNPASALTAKIAVFQEAQATLTLAATAVEAAQSTVDAAELRAADLGPEASQDALSAADASATEAADVLRQARRRHGALARACDLARVELEETVVVAKATASDLVHGAMGDLNVRFSRAAERVHQIVREAAALALSSGHPSGAFLVNMQVHHSILDPNDRLMLGSCTDLPPLPKEATSVAELHAAIAAAERAVRPPAPIQL